VLRGLSVCKIRKRYTMIHKYMPPKIDFKILIALTLTMMGFLMSIATFSISYRAHQKAYPEAQTIVTDEQKINFIAVGDIMLSRLVARRAEIANNPYWMWENIDDFLKQSDFNFWNLESPTNGTPVYSYEETMIFNAPPDLIDTLSQINFWVINLANNHALDQGESWLTWTQKLLSERGILHIGTGATLEEAWTPRIIEKNGIRIAFISASYASINDDGSTLNEYVARIQHTLRLQTAVEEAKKQADYVIVNMHAGSEYTRSPTPLQWEFARFAIDYGCRHGHRWTPTLDSVTRELPGQIYILLPRKFYFWPGL
jgi:poly-gamma-glutamate capsule biosynthesis protein CapA/YwtB (metallophosphatase superfamily)